MGGETICAFVRALGPRGFDLYNNLSVISVNNVEEMTATVKSYNSLEISKEGRKTHKEMKKKVDEEKRHEQRLPKVGHNDQKRHPVL